MGVVVLEGVVGERGGGSERSAFVLHAAFGFVGRVGDGLERRLFALAEFMI